MLSDLLQFDSRLTQAVNQWHAPWADTFMHVMSNMWTWIPLYVVLIGMIVYGYKKTSWIVLLGVVLVVGLADWTSVHFFKDVFMRLRPGRDPALEGWFRLPYGRGGGMYGFISSHACNHLAIATYVTLALQNRFRIFRYGILYVWAAVICYSRVYLAHHFVGDVLCGAAWGILLAWLVWKITRLTLAKVYPSTPRFLYRPPKK